MGFGGVSQCHGGPLPVAAWPEVGRGRRSTSVTSYSNFEDLEVGTSLVKLLVRALWYAASFSYFSSSLLSFFSSPCSLFFVRERMGG